MKPFSTIHSRAMMAVFLGAFSSVGILATSATSASALSAPFENRPTSQPVVGNQPGGADLSGQGSGPSVSPEAVPPESFPSSDPSDAQASVAGAPLVGNSLALPPLQGIQSITSLLDGFGYCALMTAGTVYCWGLDSYGQLGDGVSGTNSNVPVQVSGITDATALSSDSTGFCALLSTGAVDCWGNGQVGQLGDGSNVSSAVPVQATLAAGATDLSSDGTGYCAVLTTKQIQCWGDDGYGDLGNGSTMPHSDIPLFAVGISNAKSVTGSFFSSGYCALLTNGNVKCWGYNGRGELGRGVTATYVDTPGLVKNITGVLSITGGTLGYCAVTSTAHAYCWGNGANGQLGDGKFDSSNVPVEVGPFSSAASISNGDESPDYCGLETSGQAQCWGANGKGQLGNGTTTNSNVSVPVSGQSTATQLTSDRVGYCALDSGGSVQCWGADLSGQLGDGLLTNSTVPVPVSAVSDAIEVTGDAAGYCAVLATQTAVCWGSNASGSLGAGISGGVSDTPQTVKN